MIRESADVVVVGGGIIGTSIAFHLAEAGVHVCPVERGELACGSTSRAAGGVRAQFSDPLNVQICLRRSPLSTIVEGYWARVLRSFVGHLWQQALADRASAERQTLLDFSRTHEQILEALRSQDEASASAHMREHLEHGLGVLRRQSRFDEIDVNGATDRG
jgi:glycine/D-amino acid oxidase-like deaminating enzyme